MLGLYHTDNTLVYDQMILKQLTHILRVVVSSKSTLMHYFTSRGLGLYEQKIREAEEEYRGLHAQLQDALENGGDAWHDNFSFEELQRQIGMKSGQVQKLKGALLNFKVIEKPPEPLETVVIGCEVTLSRQGVNETWQIGGYGESDPKSGIVAYDTPLGKVLLKKKVRDRFTFMKKEIVIVAIK